MAKKAKDSNNLIVINKRTTAVVGKSLFLVLIKRNKTINPILSRDEKIKNIQVNFSNLGSSIHKKEKNSSKAKPTDI